MARQCSAKVLNSGFVLKDDQIEMVYESQINEWKNGGAYIPIPKGHGPKKVYVVVRR